MANVIEVRRRGLLASSFALILATALTIPTTTDARGGAGTVSGHGGGGRATLGIARVLHSASAKPHPPHRVAAGSLSTSSSLISNRQRFAHRSPRFDRRHMIGSHFFTLGADGVWLDRFVYVPTVLVASRPIPGPDVAQSRRLVTVKKPSPSRRGIILVRGDSKSYVVFPPPKRS